METPSHSEQPSPAVHAQTYEGRPALNHERPPYPWYSSMRQSNPLFYDAERHTWNVFRYADIDHILMNPGAFSSDIDGRQSDTFSLVTEDPPQHTRIRAAVAQDFSPRTISKLAPQITSLVHSLLDQVAASGKMDIITQLAYPLPVTVISLLLGVPLEDQPRLNVWIENWVAETGRGQGFAAYDPAMVAYFYELVEKKRAQPQDDLMSRLLVAQEAGDLSLAEMVNLCMLLTNAGYETTVSLIGNALLCFLEHPETIEQLRQHPEQMPNALHEVMRYDAPIQGQYRRVAQDTSIDGKTLQAGQMVMLWLGSANHDAAAFSNPDQFDITRVPNRHLALGHGIHYCLGAPLGLLETQIALQVFIERFRDIQLDPNMPPPEPRQNMLLKGLTHLHVIFKSA